MSNLDVALVAGISLAAMLTGVVLGALTGAVVGLWRIHREGRR